MFETERIIAAAAIAWTVIALLVQAVSARGTGRRDYSVRAGTPLSGIVYNFTWAMLPKHKETISLHPVKFTIGLLMHVGIFLAILKLFLLLIFPQITPLSPVAFGVVLGIGALCGLYLLIRRALSVELRAMSSPEDYLSILITVAFITVAITHEFGLISSGIFLIHASVLFFYIPFGKLRHALFFFIARADYGARLGYRGTYPAKSGSGELMDAGE